MSTLLNIEKISKEDLINKTSHLVGELKKIKIAFPKMNKGNTVLYHQIKIIEIALLLNITDNSKDTKYELKHTKDVLVMLANEKILFKTYNKLHNELNKDKYLLTFKNIKSIQINQLKISIQTKAIDRDNSIAEIFDDLSWNSDKTIIDSFNYIMSNKNLSLKLINTCVIDYDNLLLKNNLIIYKYLIRKIISIYGIKLDISINEFSDTEKNIINSIEFNSLIASYFKDI